MMGSVPWAVVRDSSNRQKTDADRFVRREYGGPSARWLLSPHRREGTSAHAVQREKAREQGLFRRLTQAVATIFLVVSLIPRQP
ncbi:MAG: hypothetical protein E6J98_08720 [Methanobacteriota archaeon]|nr:MAG: hypothetical protein E6J98_08720 [Euryarchaeota archaeon]